MSLVDTLVDRIDDVIDRTDDLIFDVIDRIDDVIHDPRPRYKDLPSNTAGVGWHHGYLSEVPSHIASRVRGLVDSRCIGVYVDTSSDGPLPRWPWLPRFDTRNGGPSLWTPRLCVGVAITRPGRPVVPAEIRRRASRHPNLRKTRRLASPAA